MFVLLVQFIIISFLAFPPEVRLFSYHYPPWTTVLGYCIGVSSFVCVPAYMIYCLLVAKGTFKQVAAPGFTSLCGDGFGILAHSSASSSRLWSAAVPESLGFEVSGQLKTPQVLLADAPSGPGLGISGV